MSFLSEHTHLRILFEAFTSTKMELYVVGGAVRDYILGKVPKDVDLATNARPEKIIEILKSIKLPAIPVGIQWGTVATLIENKQVEITTYRSKEYYSKGSRKPEIIFGDNLSDDLRRRDFRFNSMAIGADDKLIDPFSGQLDLAFHVINTPSNPYNSFEDDPLRLLRACRFATRLNAELDILTFNAAKDCAPEIKNVSVERIFDELSKILMEDKPSAGIKLAGCMGIYKEILPEVQAMIDMKKGQGKYHSKELWQHVLGVIDNSPAILPVRWAAWLHDIGKPDTYEETENGIHFIGHEHKGEKIFRQIAKRLKMSNEFTETVSLLIREHLAPSLLSDGFILTAPEGKNQASKSALRRFIRRLKTQENLNYLFALSAADITSHKEDLVKEKIEKLELLKQKIEEVQQEQDITQVKLPTGTGDRVVILLGFSPGPRIGRILKHLEQKLIDGELTDITDKDILNAQEELQLY